VARKAEGPNRYLTLHDNIWRVSIGVPKPLREQLGSHLSKSLGTSSIVHARMKRDPVVAEFKRRIEMAWQARGGRKRSLLAEAIEVREMLKTATPEMADFLEQGLQERLDEIRRSRKVRYEKVHDPEEGLIEVERFDPEAEEEARAFSRAAHGADVPIRYYHDAFIATLKISERSALDEPRALNVLLDWLSIQNPPIQPWIGNIDETVATKFMDEMPRFTQLSWATNAKYFGRIRLYWAWLKKRRHAKENPFSDLAIEKERTQHDEEERAYADGEIQRLFMGEPMERDAMLDVMRVAALTGARLDAVIDLRVGECADGWFTFKPQKKEPSARDVPIHPDLVPIVKRRIAGKNPGDELFPEWPAPRSVTSTRPRSAYFSKRYTVYTKSIGVREELEGKRRSLVNFHSFRRWFITKMERAGVNGDIIAAIVGHKRSGLTLGRYSEGPQMPQAIEAIAKVRLPPLDGSPVAEDRALTPT
jgi:integrase